LGPLVKFFVLTYAVMWSCFIPVAAGIPAYAPLGAVLLLLGTFAPSLVAVWLTARAEGDSGLRALLGGVLRWRVAAGWYLFALAYIPAIKLTVGDEGAVDPLLLTFLRLVLAATSAVAFLVVRRRATLSVFRNKRVWLLGALNAIGFDLQHVGEVYTTASKTALLVDVNVVFIALLMVAIYHERIRARRALGILLGLVGVAVLTTRVDPSFLRQGEFRGDVLVLLAGIVWAGFVVEFKATLDRGGDYLTLSAAVLATTAVFSAAALPWADLSRPVSGLGWIGIVWLGLVTTFPPIAAWARSIRVMSPTVAAIILLLEIAVASALSIAFLGEPFGLFFVLGGILVLAGIAAASVSEKRTTGGDAAGPRLDP